MRRSALVRLLAAGAMVVAVLVPNPVAAGGAVGRAAGGGSITFDDASGDAQAAAPDLTTLVIGDDPANGLITVTLTANGYSTSSANVTLEEVYLNTDADTSTGAPDQAGTEYYLEGWRDSSGSYWDVLRWNGTEYVEVPPSPGMSYTTHGDTLTWTVSAADLGITAGFKFFVWSATFDAAENQTGEDVYPSGGGVDGYGLTRTATILYFTKIAAPATAPAKVSAGKRVTVAFRVTGDKDSAANPLTDGVMVCDPSVGGKVIPHTESFRNGVAKISFVVPKTAKGKTLKVKLTITPPLVDGAKGVYLSAATLLTGPMVTTYRGQPVTRIATYVVH